MVDKAHCEEVFDSKGLAGFLLDLDGCEDFLFRLRYVWIVEVGIVEPAEYVVAFRFSAFGVVPSRRVWADVSM